VLDTELVDEAPILDPRVRKAVRRNGARLVVASSRPSTLDPNAVATLRFAPGCSEAALGALVAALGSARAGALEDLAARARVSSGFVPGRPMTDGVRAANASAAPAGAAELVSAAANTLRDAGDVVVIWGERVFAGERGAQALDALLALADTLGIAGKEESGLIAIPESANGRGLREIGCTPTFGPGLADAPVTGDPDSARGALLLLEADLPEPVLTRATSVIAFASFRTEALEAQADVVFPAEVYAEKEGTITHPDGRLQRVRQALGHAGEVRPGWWVLAELCERSGVGLGVLSSPQVSALIAERVPIYTGLTLDVVGGLGARWQDHDGAEALPAEALPTDPLATPPEAPSGLQLASVPTLWSGPAVRHSPSLRFLETGPLAQLSPRDAGRLGVENGDELELSVGGERAEATALVRSSVPDDSVFVTDVDLPDGPVAIGRARSGAAVA
jgi:NADH-quinone oxidoreductase subunit G